MKELEKEAMSGEILDTWYRGQVQSEPEKGEELSKKLMKNMEIL